MDETGLTFRPFINPWLLVVLAAMLAGLSLLAYRRTTRAATRRLKLMLVALRLLAMAVVLTCLLRPTLETVHYELSKRPIVLLVDQSDSMSLISDTPDRVSRLDAVNGFLAEHKDQLEELRETYDLVQVGFARELMTGPPADQMATRYSAYGASLEQAFREAADSRADAVVLFGDGSHNLGPVDPVDAAAALNEQGVPVYTVGVGQDVATSQLRDIKVVDVRAPKTVALFSTFTVRADVLFRGCQGLQSSVRMEFPGQEPVTRSLLVTHREETVPVLFEVTPEDVGEFKLAVQAQELPHELLATNNSRTTFVKVVSEGARVGFFDALRPESKFIAQALDGAQQLRMRRVLVLPGRQVPIDQADPDRYDVLVVGDLPARAIQSSRWLEWKKAVQTDGKGLLLLLGSRSGGAQGLRGSLAEDLLPVTFVRSMRPVPGDREFLPVRQCASHPIVALRSDPQATVDAWRQMPRLSGALVGVEPKRGATVLATDQDGNPLLVAHRSGAGRVACLTADTTFRWFFTDRDTQDDHRRFWRQLILWVAGREEEPESRLRIELSKQRLLVNEQLGISVQLTEAGGQPIRDAEIDLRVTAPDEAVSPIPFAFSRTESAYLADYTPQVPGDFTVTAEARRKGELIGTQRARFHSTSINPELEDPIADMKLLRRISAVTESSGGRYYHYLQAAQLFPDLRQRGGPLKLVTRQRRDVWDAWYAAALFILCLTAEWVVRKWKGLV
jgi:uncharacterized membrane protein